MFGLDKSVAAFPDGTTLLVLIAVAVALGLRHATDPDHLAAVSTLISSGRERSTRLAARLGLLWGLGHATTLFAFGLPIVLYRAYLPAPVQEGAEASVGLVIVALAAGLLLRWHRGVFHPASHSHAAAGRNVRSPLQAYGIGLVHGMGGSAGIGILLLSGIQNRILAIAALAIFAFFTAASMAALSCGLGATLGAGPVRSSFHRFAPALGVSSMVFGVWYALGALSLAPYYL